MVKISGNIVASIALCLGMAGCFGGGRPAPSVVSKDPGAKIPAIKKAASAHDSQTAQQLVKDLDSQDSAVRFYAIRGLQSLTGETFGYVWYADEKTRETATDKWKKWIDANADSLANGDTDRKSP
jgi:hypothetical protein